MVLLGRQEWKSTCLKAKKPWNKKRKEKQKKTSHSSGQYNLKTVHFKETLASGNFLPWSSAIRVCFFSTLSTTVVIEKTGSQVSLLSLKTLMRPFIVKMTWSRLGGFDFYSVVPVLANAAMKFRSAVIALAAGVPSITNFQRELLSKQLIQSVSSQKLLRAKRYSPYILFQHILPNLCCF